MRALFVLALASAACAAVEAPPQHARLLVGGAEHPIDDARVVSRGNANESFRVTLLVRDGGAVRDRALALEVAGERHPIPGAGFDGERTTLDFVVERAEAERVAAALGVPLRERSHPGHALTGRFEGPGELRVGSASIPLVLVIENDGEPVTYLDGGRGRNALGRDERFSFCVTRDGEPVETVDVVDFGGLGVWRALEPGRPARLEVDFAKWVAPHERGTYRVEGAYAIEIGPAAGAALPPHELEARQWDDVVRGELELVVR